MGSSRHNRRRFLQASAGLAAGSAAICHCPSLFAQEEERPTETMFCRDVIPPAIKDRSPVRAALQTEAEFSNEARSSGQQAAKVLARAPRLAAQTSASGPSRAAALSRWPDEKKIGDEFVLRVKFVGGSSAAQDLVVAYASEWSKVAMIRFDFNNDSSADIRVGFVPAIGHWSYVGVQNVDIPLNQATMNLDTTEGRLRNFKYDRGVVIHEFGHALGLIHEHQNPEQRPIKLDKNAVRRFFSNPPNNWSPAEIDQNVINVYNQRELVKFTAYDAASIMAYHLPAHLLESGVPIKQNDELSDQDKLFMGQLYGSRGGTGTSPTEPTVQTTRKLIVDEDPIEGLISPKAPVNRYEIVLDGQKKPWLYTRGYTDVKISIHKANGKKNIAAKNPESPDLVNTRQQLRFDKGRYIVEVEHSRKGGAGEYRIGLSAKPPN